MQRFGRKTSFEIKNEAEVRGQSNPKSLAILTVPRCIFGPNLEVPILIGGELLRGHARNGVDFYFYF